MRSFLKKAFLYLLMSSTALLAAQELITDESILLPDEPIVKPPKKENKKFALGDTDAESFDNEDLDSLFDNASDTEISEETALTPQPDVTQGLTFKKFSYSGSVSATAGYMRQVTPETDDKPCAQFDIDFNAVLRPAKILTVKCDISTSFPDMEIELKALYFDYILYNIAYLTVGRTAMKWGNSRIFDTDILDDSLDTLDTDASILSTIRTDASQFFDVILTVPIVRGQIQGLAMYYPYTNAVSRDDVCFAGSIEYPIGPLSFNLFGRTWADSDKNKMEPALGLEISGELFGFQVGAWSKMNITDEGINYIKAVGSIARSWEKPKMGICLEYQHTFNAVNIELENDATHANAIAWNWTWRHMFGSQFAPIFQGFVDIENKCGAIVPGISFTGLPLITTSFVVPVFYGNQTDVNYNDLIISSTEEKTTVLIGIIIKLSVGF